MSGNVTWYSLYYVTASGKFMSLYNLQLLGVIDIERAQRELGSYNFQRVPQVRSFSEHELKEIRQSA